ncbi:Hypothetical predicted protein [Paramuricea clavata]|uniref:Uncharacterized protein n=1 Tax=Paramuricea clavata TaxID=317549 RepID=A0A6S7IUK8_PARCT|nr:Hypothetical predicted protein [Paramuricea clavata]
MGKGASRSIRGSEEGIVRRNNLDIFLPQGGTRSPCRRMSPRNISNIGAKE